jgi:CubicO group peptidase (beta-lactamase class C family)
MIRSSRLLGLLVAALLIAPAAAPAGQSADRKALDGICRDTLSRWKAPGVAVIVVRDDEVVYLHGHGVREMGKKKPVTPDTVFSLGSLTKAFAVASLALLVDDGKAGWDDLVRKYLPAFRLSESLADREVRLRDLLCHRTGLARHELLWYGAPWSLEETVKRMAFLEPASSFRSRYEYNNLGYIVAGQAIGKAAGMSWEEFVRKRLLGPLGMKNAVFTRSAALALADHAMPHRLDSEGKTQALAWYADDKQVRASGSLKASARDLAGWLRLNLNEGMVDGKRIISAEALAEMHTPQVVVPIADQGLAKLAGTTQQSYGLGWRILDYRGQRLLAHNGANDGLRARIALVPKKKLGLVVLANLEETGLVEALVNLLLDQLLGLEKKDWHGFFLQKRAGTLRERALKTKKLLATRRKGTKPSRELSAYAGTYRDRAYGEARVLVVGKRLVLAWSSYRVALEHFHFDTFLGLLEKDATSSRFRDELVRFELDGDGNVKTMRLLGRTFRRGK